MAHVKGAPKTGGRKRGQPNRVTRDARAAILAAFSAIGGETQLASWARDHLTEFYTRVYTRVVPKELEHTGNPDKPVGVTLRFGDTEIPL